jgi:proton-translocating NADH-quinone oxidoreductase chain M
MIFDPVLMIALPLLAAFLIPIFNRFSKEIPKYIPVVILGMNLYESIMLLPKSMVKPIIVVIAGWQPPLGINLTIGPLGNVLVLIISLVGFVVAIYNIKFVTEEPAEKYYMLFLLIITGATGVVLTGDLFNMFVFLEITSISAYALTAFIRDRNGAEAAFKYILIGGISSTMILLGIAIIYTTTGTLNLADIAQKMQYVDPKMALAAMILLIVGFGVESEMFPLNGWAPDAYSQAPTPVGAVFGGIVVKAGVYGLARMIYTIFNFEGVFYFIMIMGLITLLMAEMSAMRQGQIKRMLAFSSIGQMGLVLIGLGLATVRGVEGALFQMLNHALIKPLLFLSAGYLVFYSGSKNIKDLDGMGKSKPFLAFFFAFGAFAIMGLPPLNGFWSKMIIISETIRSGFVIVAAFALIGSVIEAVYYLRVVGRLYFKKQREEQQEKYVHASAIFAMSILVVLAVIIGLYPDLVLQYLKPAAEELVNKSFYIHSVFAIN